MTDMTYPEILIIDDEWTLQVDKRSGICSSCHLLDEAISCSQPDSPSEEYLARATFCSGQKEGRNSYEEVEKAVIGQDGSRRWSLVLLDVDFKEFKEFGSEKPFGIEVREKLLVSFPTLPLVMLTGKSEKEVKESLGIARDDNTVHYFSKLDIKAKQLRVKLLAHGALTSGEQEHLLRLKQHGIIAKAPAMIELFRDAITFAERETSVLILGETGTGKERVADYIHRLSGRPGPYIPRNVSEIPKDLVAPELFGIAEKVATGVAGRAGLLLEANKGTLFLDEIGDMPLDAQVKLLRTFEGKSIVITGERGEKRETKINVRFLSATAQDMGSLISAGKFRYDLYHRVAQKIIHIPPLRERREDIPELARHYLKEFQDSEQLKEISLSDEALVVLEAQPFPGNVRELKNLVDRLAAGKGNREIISEQDVSSEIKTSKIFVTVAPVPGLMQQQDDVSTHTTPIVDFADLETLLKNIRVPTSSSELKGKLTLLQHAYGQLLQRMLEAALQQTKVTGGNKNFVAAIRLLGQDDLKGTYRASDLLRRLNKMFSFIPSPGSELAVALKKAEGRSKKDTGKLPKGDETS